jgi:hypothetical protein
MRDWSKFANAEKLEHVHENRHGAINYHCHYSWTFNKNGHHKATLTMNSSDGKKETTRINFAQRTPEQYIELSKMCGLTPVLTGQHGEGSTTFHVVIMQKPNP